MRFSMSSEICSGIMGIGIDLVSLMRFERCVQRWGERFFHRIFTEQELSLCSKKSMPHQSLAVRFAAKEAIMKALGTGWSQGIKWKDISIEEQEYGKPYVAISSSAWYLKGKKIHISLTHTDENAMAFVIIECRENKT